jgi:hypothetical protein
MCHVVLIAQAPMVLLGPIIFWLLNGGWLTRLEFPALDIIFTHISTSYPFN